MYLNNYKENLTVLASLIAGALLTISAPAQTFTVTVPGNSGRHWVNTGRYLSPNTRVEQRATGRVNLSADRGVFGPEGTNVFVTGDGFPADTPRRYGLVARLTSSLTDPEDELRDTDRDYGSAPSFCAAQGGNLWLTVNDNMASDNTGLFTVDVTLGTCSGAPPPPPRPATGGDLRVTGMEITQSTQVYPGNLVPLVGYKKTLVRVYVQADNGSGGPWTDVTGRLTVRNLSGTHAGAMIVDRFLLPVTADSRSAITASTAGSHRDSYDDSLNFVLDIDQTAPGEREFTVDISSVSGRRETDSTNNRLVQRARFGPPRYVSVFGVGYGTRNSGAGCSAPINPPTPPEGSIIPFSAFEAHRRYAESAYPVSAFFVNPLPGGSDGMLFDNSDCLAHEPAQAWLTRQVDRMFPRGAVRAYLLTPTYNPAGYHGSCCSGSNGNLVAHGNDLRSDPGPTLAHEIGHSFGRQHTFEDSRYPYPDGSIGANTGMRSNLGFFGFGINTVPARNADNTPANFDFMSYTASFWISPYTYCGLLDAISGGASACSDAGRRGTSTSLRSGSAMQASPQGGMVAPDGEQRAFVYVAGRIDPKLGASFEPFEIVRSSDDLTSKSGSGPYTVRLEGGAGAALGEYSFGPNPYYPNDSFRFSAWIPLQPRIAQVILVEGKRVLASRKVTPNAPQVTLFPITDSVLKGRQKIGWKAFDADGDQLTFAVDYSVDGGTTWLRMRSISERTSASTGVQRSLCSLPTGTCSAHCSPPKWRRQSGAGSTVSPMRMPVRRVSSRALESRSVRLRSSFCSRASSSGVRGRGST